MKIFLSPHHDDETLFGAFTLLRERPLVVIVTDSYVQFHRDGITNEARWRETQAAMDVLGLSPAIGLGVRDDTITPSIVALALTQLRDRYRDQVTDVYTPAIQHGHPHHDIIGEATLAVFRGHARIWQYCTYSARDRFYANEGAIEVRGTPTERFIKAQAMDVYRSQMARSWRHFRDVDGKSEWLTEVR